MGSEPPPRFFLPFPSTLWQDLGAGWLSLRRRPLFTLAATLVLALGIGANTAVLSVVEAVLLRPLPYPDAEELAVVRESVEYDPTPTGNFSDYLDCQAAQRSFTDLALAGPVAFNFTGREAPPERLIGGEATANYLPVLGVRPLLGRNFTAQEDTPGGPKAVLLGEALWRRRFGADPAVLGRYVFLDGRAHEVVGVLPTSALEFRPGAQFLVPVGDHRADPEALARTSHFDYRILGRLRRGVTLRMASEDIRLIAAELARRYPETNASARTEVVSLREATAGGYRASLSVLLTMVGCVLLVACANVANLQLVRATGRAHELALRLALGAGRRRLVRQLLTESALLGVLGGAAGLLFAFELTEAIVAFAPADAPRFREVRVDGTALGVAALLALGSGLAAGVWPAWSISRRAGELTSVLSASGQSRGGSGGPGARRTRSLLVITQVALATVLLSSAGLLLHGLLRAQAEPIGFAPQGLLSASVQLPEARYDTPEKRALFVSAWLERVRTLPGVAAAATSYAPPFNHQEMITSLHVGGTPPDPSGHEPTVLQNIVSGEYFVLMRMPVRRGRGFDALPPSEQRGAVIIDERVAQRFFPGRDPVGQSIDEGPGTPPLTVVGVVPHVSNDAPEVGSPAESMGFVYFSAAARPTTYLKLLVRVDAGDPLLAAEPLRRAVLDLDPELPIAAVATMAGKVAASHAPRRWLVTLLVGFGAVALLLAGVGLYGVLALSVAQRTRELGIRLALGATRTGVRLLVLREGGGLVGGGLALGLLGALVLGRVLATFLSGVEGADGWTLASITLGLMLTTLLACWWPMRRAGAVDPAVALRQE